MTSLDTLRLAIETPLPNEEAPTLSTKELVRALYSTLASQRQLGVSWETLANRLQSQDVQISGSTLSRYMVQSRPKKRSRK